VEKKVCGQAILKIKFRNAQWTHLPEHEKDKTEKNPDRVPIGFQICTPTTQNFNYM
jgi:hypothetical protein